MSLFSLQGGDYRGEWETTKEGGVVDLSTYINQPTINQENQGSLCASVELQSTPCASKRFRVTVSEHSVHMNFPEALRSVPLNELVLIPKPSVVRPV